MELRNARIRAGWMASSRTAGESTGVCRGGMPIRGSAMWGAASNHSAPASVPAISATSALGTTWCSLGGHTMNTARVMSATASASPFRFATACGQDAMMATIPMPGSTGAPRNHSVWLMKM